MKRGECAKQQRLWELWRLYFRSLRVDWYRECEARKLESRG